MRSVPWFSWGSVVVCVLSLVLFGWTFQQRSQDQSAVEKLALETNHALCTFRIDLQRRYIAGLALFNKNPQGIAGIPSEEIARSLANQKATLDSLSSLDCQ